MKKIIAAAVIAALTVALTGCSSPQTEEPVQQPQEQPAPTQPEPEQKAAATPDEKADVVGTSFSNEAPSDPSPYISEGGWTYIESQGGDFANYGLMLGCTDPVNCYVLMPLKITAKADDGSILASETTTVMFIGPDDVMPVTGLLPLTEKPASIEFDLSFDQGSKPGNDYKITDLPVSNTSEIVTDPSTKWTGEFSNDTGVDFPNGIFPCAILRDNGKIVGGVGLSGDSAPVANGETSSFEVTGLKGSFPDHDDYELYIVPNLIF